MDNLRYQNIYEIKEEKPVFKKMELFASVSKLKELQQILTITDINIQQQRLIAFDLEMLNILFKYKDKLKQQWTLFSFNLYPVTLLWLINNQNKPNVEIYINKLKQIAKELNWNFSIEILENWLLDYSLQNKDKSKLYFDFLKSIWITISIDDIIINGMGDFLNKNNHTLHKMINLFKEENVKYLKFDISFTNYLVNKPLILNILFKMISRKYNNKIIILEWIETENMVKVFEKYKHTYNNIKIYYQWYFFHKPETLDLDDKNIKDENKQ